MGYGYIGSYLVFGIDLGDCKEFLKEFTDTEDEEIDKYDFSCIDMTKYGTVSPLNKKPAAEVHGGEYFFFKRYGFDPEGSGEKSICLCYGNAFKGGNYWGHETIDVQYMNELETKKSEISAIMLKFLEDHEVKCDSKLQWFNLIAAGISIY